jgi:hypothetical protein
MRDTRTLQLLSRESHGYQLLRIASSIHKKQLIR